MILYCLTSVFCCLFTFTQELSAQSLNGARLQPSRGLDSSFRDRSPQYNRNYNHSTPDYSDSNPSKESANEKRNRIYRNAFQKYPELANPNSEIRKHFMALYKEYDDGDPDFFRNDNWPLILATKADAVLTGRQSSSERILAETGYLVNKVDEGSKRSSLRMIIHEANPIHYISLLTVKGHVSDFTRIDSFQIGRNELTWKEWRTVRDSTKGYDLANIGNSIGDIYPVINVSWHDAVKWCNAASELAGLTPAYTVDGEIYRTGNLVPHYNKLSNGYRLPTVNEWLYAANGGNPNGKFKYSGGNDLHDVGWFKDNSRNSIQPVAQKKANELGIYDMTGNVFEWCWDKAFCQFNKDLRNVRGGSWNCISFTAELTFNWSDNSSRRFNQYGFRVARSIIEK